MSQPRDPPNRKEPLTSALVSRAEGGDADAFLELYGRLASDLGAWADLRVDGPIRAMLDPEDLAHEVWCRAMEKFSSYNGEKTTFRAWFFAIARNVHLEALRRAARRPYDRPEIGVAHAAVSPGDVVARITSITRQAVRSEEMRLLLRQLDSLSRDERQLVLLRGIEELSYAAIARGLGIGVSVESLKKRWQRLRLRLCSERCPIGLAE